MGRLSDTAGVHTETVYSHMAAREEALSERWSRLEDGEAPFRYRTDRLARFRCGKPVEVEMAALPEWAPQKLLPPSGRVTVTP